MTYQETIDYLYSRMPSFEKQGKQGYKPGLDTTRAMDKVMEHPHTQYPTIHVAGTNGKGSVCHLLAATLQQTGLKVGLYTSPHLKDFNERVRVNGIPVPHDYVTQWVQKWKNTIEQLHPSFFEATMMLAFQYFADEQVDVAIIEVGLGGRLDSTNIITPQLCVITNISFDHTDLLGDTLGKIAAEKAGIIKHNVPVVIGESGTKEVSDVFKQKAAEVGAPLVWAEQANVNCALKMELQGAYQDKNKRTALTAIEELRKIGYQISQSDIQEAFAHFATRTGLQGRWQTIGTNPLIICDTGHNPGGFEYTAKQIAETPCKTLRIVLGMVADKDVDSVLSLLPQLATYYFTAPHNKRALSPQDMAIKATAHNLNGKAYPTSREALNAAKQDADKDDFIFVGGSTYLVAEIL